MRHIFLIALLALQTSLLLAAHCHDTDPTFGPPNNFPVFDGMANMKEIGSVPNGTISSIYVPNGGNGSVFYLLHVWGSPYQMGVAQGRLYKKAGIDLPAFFKEAWEYYLKEIEKIDFLKELPEWLRKLVAQYGLEVALQLTEYATMYWTGPYFYEEMQGLADGSGMTQSEFRRLKYIHMLPGLTEGKCSMIGSWGPALDPTNPCKLLQLRALDWDMRGPFRNLPAAVVYHPDAGNGHPFINIGVGGFIGGLTGVSAAQLGISEIGVSYPDSTFGEESRVGIPFVFLLRDILQFDKTLDQALTRIVDTKRTCNLILGVGDGKSSSFRGVAYSATKVTIMDDTNQLPLESWHPRINSTVYWGMDWKCPGDNLVLSTQILKHYGKITPEVAISQLTAVEQSGSNHLAYYDLTNLLVYVSFAAPHGGPGPVNGYERQFTSLDAKKLFAVNRP